VEQKVITCRTGNDDVPAAVEGIPAFVVMDE